MLSWMTLFCRCSVGVLQPFYFCLQCGDNAPNVLFELLKITFFSMTIFSSLLRRWFFSRLISLTNLNCIRFDYSKEILWFCVVTSFNKFLSLAAFSASCISSSLHANLALHSLMMFSTYCHVPCFNILPITINSAPSRFSPSLPEIFFDIYCSEDLRYHSFKNNKPACDQHNNNEA